MDSLTFGSPILIRGMSTNKSSKKLELVEIELPKVLAALKLSFEQFVDLCLLCGCDYMNQITGIGPIKAYKFIQEYKNIDKVLEYIRKEIAQSTNKRVKYILPEEYPYEEARHIFLNNEYPEMLGEVNEQMKWTKPNEEEMKEFLVKEKNFSEEKVHKGLQKLVKFQPTMGKT